MVLAICGSMLYQSYRQTSLAAVDNAKNVTLVAERAISRNFEVLSLALDSLAYRYQHPISSQSLPSSEQYLYLFGNTASLNHVSVMAILDAHGNVRMSSRRHGGQVVASYADRAYFTVHRDSPDAGLYVSRPIAATFGKDLKVVVLSKRLNRPDGSFDGIVVMALDLAYFRDLFEGLALGEDGIMSLYSDDGVVYMRIPYQESVIGTDASTSPNFLRVKAILQNTEGSFFSLSRKDNVKRLYTFRRVPHSALIVFVGHAESAIFGDWYDSLYSVMLALLAFVFITVVLVSSIRREFRRRVAAETQLKEMTRTDGLTSLLNRRALDEVLEATWERSQRNASTTFSLLFVDVDYFKFYNDTYGHKSGDEVLQEVARTIERNLPRSTDCVARYGGEEFVVLLQETSEEGAMIVAHRLCDAVREREIAHATSSVGTLTVSIGVAAFRGSEHHRIEDVLHAADEALYRAKRTGRNRAQCASEKPLEEI